MQGKPEQSLILDSTPWIPDHICNLSGIPDSFSCIPDSKAQGSEFHQLKFPGFRNLGSLTWGETNKARLPTYPSLS